MKNSYQIPKVSKKRRSKLAAQKKTYAEFDREREPGLCSGCGKWVPIIDHSHLLSQYKFNDLLAEKKNIVPHGQYCCHPKWHNPVERWELDDFIPNMLFIYSHSRKVCDEMVGTMDIKVYRHRPEKYQEFLKVIEQLEIAIKESIYFNV